MKARKTKMVGWIVLLAACPVFAADSNGVPPYMGQEPPGLTPKVFAPGLVSLPNRFEHSICLSQDERECYITVPAANWSTVQIMVTRYENGQWTSPVQAVFSNSQSQSPSLTDNDQSLYFSRDRSIWKVHRSLTGSGIQAWSQPEVVPAPVTSPQGAPSCSISSLGNMWICSWRTGGVGQCDLWRIQSANGQFTEATDLRSLNTTASDCYPVPGPDEAYVIWQSDCPGGFGGIDLYISLADGHGGWTAPRNLGPIINSSRSEGGPSLSPDYRYLFFNRETSNDSNIYWVSVKAFLPDPNGPVYNLSTGQRFASIQAALNYAESGQVISIAPGTYHENIVVPNLPLTIRSTNPQDSAVVSLTSAVGDGTSAVVTLAPGSALRSLQGLTITGGADGIVCTAAQLKLSSCVLTGNRDCGIEVSNESMLSLDHCILAGNGGAGLYSVPVKGRRLVYSKVDLNHCTITQNRGYALDGDGITVSNSILSGNGLATGNVQSKSSNVAISYSDVQGGFTGQGNTDADPLFVTSGSWADPNTYVAGDHHLKSEAGHWNANASIWVPDDVTSPCIDAGDPTASFSLEPAPNGGRANLGAYGNTTEASRTPME